MDRKQEGFLIDTVVRFGRRHRRWRTSRQALKTADEESAKKGTERIGDHVVEAGIALRNVALKEFDEETEGSTREERIEDGEACEARVCEIGAEKKAEWHETEDVGEEVAIVSPRGFILIER